jgi:hypothetical protein
MRTHPLGKVTPTSSIVLAIGIDPLFADEVIE